MLLPPGIKAVACRRWVAHLIIMMKNVLVPDSRIPLMLGIVLAVGILFPGALVIVLGRKFLPGTAS